MQDRINARLAKHSLGYQALLNANGAPKHPSTGGFNGPDDIGGGGRSAMANRHRPQLDHISKRQHGHSRGGENEHPRCAEQKAFPFAAEMAQAHKKPGFRHRHDISITSIFALSVVRANSVELAEDGAGWKVIEVPEFNFIADCCSWNFRNDHRVDGLVAPRDINWDQFIQLVQFHRIDGLASRALAANRQSLPKRLRSMIKTSSTAIAARNLEASAECRTLLERFTAANLPLLFLKGLTLGMLAYGNPALKSAIDIDLLIDPANLGNAAELLQNSGYRSIAPRAGLGGQALHAWHRDWKESVWVKNSPTLRIDLHTRTADNRRVIPDITVHSPTQSVAIGSGISLPTLASDELFAYLAVHGASSAWFRLKWISDFAALLHKKETEEIRHLYLRSQQLGAGRAAGQALLLADELFGTLDEVPELRAMLSKDRPTLRIHRAASKLLRKSREPTQRSGGTITIHWTQLLLLPGVAFPLSELGRQTKKLIGRAAL